MTNDKWRKYLNSSSSNDSSHILSLSKPARVFPVFVFIFNFKCVRSFGRWVAKCHWRHTRPNITNFYANLIKLYKLPKFFTSSTIWPKIVSKTGIGRLPQSDGVESPDGGVRISKVQIADILCNFETFLEISTFGNFLGNLKILKLSWKSQNFKTFLEISKFRNLLGNLKLWKLSWKSENLETFLEISKFWKFLENQKIVKLSWKSQHLETF